MSPSVWFLGVALVVSLVGTAVLAWRHRSPQRFDTSINDFSRRMSTLAPADERGPRQMSSVNVRRPENENENENENQNEDVADGP